mgnify:CR=1 FL=1
MVATRHDIPSHEQIPDPKVLTWIPCQHDKAMQYDALSRRTDTHSTLLVARTRLVRGSLARASDIRSEKMWKSATTNGGDQEAYHDGVAIDARRCRVSKGAGDTSAKRIHAAAVRWSSSAADGGERGGGACGCDQDVDVRYGDGSRCRASTSASDQDLDGRDAKTCQSAADVPAPGRNRRVRQSANGVMLSMYV